MVTTATYKNLGNGVPTLAWRYKRDPLACELQIFNAKPAVPFGFNFATLLILTGGIFQDRATMAPRKL